MLIRLVFACAVLAALAGPSVGAFAQERFALVLGNSNYKTVAALPNPANDAKAVAGLLEEAGFEVVRALDLGQSDMLGAVQDFAARLDGKGEATVALIYFAGHGVQIDGENYLLPVDASIAREADVALEGVRLADIMNVLDTVPSRTRIVILDACRNNPFEEISGTTGRGLAIVNAPAGSIVAYSTSPGAVAEDGTGANSPFTAALVEAARKPGAGIETVFQNVRLAVHNATKGRQTPWEVTALTTPFAFFPGDGGAVSAPEPEKTEAEWSQELRSYSPKEAYETVLRVDSVTVYQVFLAIFPDSSWGRRIQGILDRRLEMLAWYEAVTLNSAPAFEAFLARYPDSDLAPTARRLEERARLRSALVSASPGALGLAPEPVVREVRVPSPPEIRTVVKEVVREVKVPVEVIKEVKVPVEVIKEVRVPVVKEVVKEVKVPVVKEVVKVVRVPSPPKTVVKTVRVPVPCNCKSSSGSSRNVPTLQFNSRSLR